MRRPIARKSPRPSRRLVQAAAFAVLVLSRAWSPAHPETGAPDSPESGPAPIEIPARAGDRILVKFKAGTGKGGIAKILSKHGLKQKSAVDELGVRLFLLPPKVSPEAMIERLKREPEVEFAEADALLPPAQRPSGEPAGPEQEPSIRASSSTTRKPWIKPDEVKRMLIEGEPFELIDIRAKDQYASGHLAGSRNIPFYELSRASVPSGRPIIVYCPQQSCSLAAQAADALSKQGCRDVRVLEGGYEGAVAGGFPAESVPAGKSPAPPCSISPDELKAKLASGAPPDLIDLRPEREFKAGHIPGAKNRPLEFLDSRPAELGSDRSGIVLYDRLAERVSRALEKFASSGLSACGLDGGLAVWAARGYPLDSSP